jgi:hypothetical protein
MVVRWTFWDPVAAQTYEFELNPVEGGSPPYKKKVSYENTSAPDGKVLIYEGQDETQTMQWSGVILTQEHFEQYVDWWHLRRQLRLTDDLGRQFWVYITAFEPTRVKAFSHPWKHRYTVTAMILDWP